MDETLFHCVRDCPKAKEVWQRMGLDTPHTFCNNNSIRDWIMEGVQHSGSLFLSVVWCIWKSRNTMVFEQKITPLWNVVHSIISSAKVINNSCCTRAPNRPPRMVKWDPPSRDQVTLNMDDSVSDNRVGFGGLVRTADGEWITGYYGSLGNGDIIRAELFAILQGLQLCWDLSFKEINSASCETLWMR
ncbi:Ribonuclease H-like superfamily [Sesbania bispinosa]|nr:Ribonuclease H-like superfamily [Sesbania bispinosa]